MRESPDTQLEADIARALRFSPTVTRVQQLNARERLLERAAEQAMLPPLMAEEAEPLPSLRDHAAILGQSTLRVIQFLFLDSSMYERARQLPHFHTLHHSYSRHSMAMLRMSA